MAACQIARWSVTIHPSIDTQFDLRATAEKKTDEEKRYTENVCVCVCVYKTRVKQQSAVLYSSVARLMTTTQL